MKVYTEIVYKWDDEKSELVEESSKSYEYHGEVTKCDRRTKKVMGQTVAYWHPHGGTAKDVQDTAEDLGEGKIQDLAEAGLGNLQDTLGDPAGSTESILTGGKDFLEDTGTLDAIREGPGGDIGKAVDAVYGGSLKEGVGRLQNFYKEAEGGFNYYKDNFNKDRTSDNSDEVDAAIDALENPEDAEDEAGMTPEEIEERRRRRGGSRAEGGSVMKRGRQMHVTGTESRGTILSPA